jgi:hypothetical protein
MDERLSEATLRELEAMLGPFNPATGAVQQLVDEVRRLRGLIERSASLSRADFDALLAEAEAIRREKGGD